MLPRSFVDMPILAGESGECPCQNTTTRDKSTIYLGSVSPGSQLLGWTAGKPGLLGSWQMKGDETRTSHQTPNHFDPPCNFQRRLQNMSNCRLCPRIFWIQHAVSEVLAHPRMPVFVFRCFKPPSDDSRVPRWPIVDDCRFGPRGRVH